MATGKIIAPSTALTPKSFTLTHNAGTPVNSSAYVYGKLAIINVMSAAKSWSQNDVVFTVPAAYRPLVALTPNVFFGGSGISVAGTCKFSNTDGKFTVNLPASIGNSRCYVNFCYFIA